MGGDVIPSLGGFSADEGGTEIGDSCANVNQIAQAYENVITTYDVSRLDMDIESNSLNKPAGIDRRNRAIKMVQDWAVAHNRPLKISYTLPTSRTGLDSDGLAVLQNAVSNGVRIDIVTPMVFDYYDGEALDMGNSAITALKGPAQPARVPAARQDVSPALGDGRRHHHEWPRRLPDEHRDDDSPGRQAAQGLRQVEGHERSRDVGDTARQRRLPRDRRLRRLLRYKPGKVGVHEGAEDVHEPLSLDGSVRT